MSSQLNLTLASVFLLLKTPTGQVHCNVNLHDWLQERFRFQIQIGFLTTTTPRQNIQKETSRKAFI